VQQRQAQRLLKLAQVLAHRRGRHAQLARRGAQGACGHDFGKYRHAFELVHGQVVLRLVLLHSESEIYRLFKNL
jgi:hypothetical protein